MKELIKKLKNITNFLESNSDLPTPNIDDTFEEVDLTFWDDRFERYLEITFGENDEITISTSCTHIKIPQKQLAAKDSEEIGKLVKNFYNN